MWDFVAEKDPLVFSHHPPGPAFREHVWKIGGLYFCKGCVVTFSGTVFGLVFAAASGWLQRLTDLQVAWVFLALLLPTPLVHLLRLPRSCKHLARFFLGLLISSAVLMLFVTDSWAVRLTIVATYFVAKIPMERMRNRENRKIEGRCGCETKEAADADRRG